MHINFLLLVVPLTQLAWCKLDWASQRCLSGKLHRYYNITLTQQNLLASVWTFSSRANASISPNRYLLTSSINKKEVCICLQYGVYRNSLQDGHMEVEDDPHCTWWKKGTNHEEELTRYIWPVPFYHEMLECWGRCQVELLLSRLEATMQPAIAWEGISTTKFQMVGECNGKK